MKVSLSNINQVIPQRVFVMLEQKSFEVLFIGLCGDEQHDEAVVSIAIVFFI